MGVGIVVILAKEARFAVMSALYDVRGYSIKVDTGTTRYNLAVAETIESGPFNSI